MGNSLPQWAGTGRTKSKMSKDDPQGATLKKSKSLRDYTRSNSLINGSTQKNSSASKSKTIAPIDAEIIDMSTMNSDSPLDQNKFQRQMDYMRSCVRKDKGIFGRRQQNSKRKFRN